MIKILIIFCIFHQSFISSTQVSINVLMPNVTPNQKDLYLCHKIRLDDERPIYITEFHPKATKETVHHMLLYSCAETVDEEIWNCGEMSKSKNEENFFKNGPICTSTQKIIYAWAKDAPELILPKDVAFQIGGKTDKKYLVLQVHYANIDEYLEGKTDNSGVLLNGQYEPVKNLAGVYFSGTGGFIKSNQEEYFEAACELFEDIEIHPFAFRTHAHKLGLVNSGYVVKKNQKTGIEQWIEIGRRSPQLPQMFFPVTNNVTVKKGDILVSRCTMENTQDHTVYIGSTGDDEMCNFYIMYFVNGLNLLKNSMCYTPGPPFWYFKDFRTSKGAKLNMKNVPKEMSEVPEMNQEEMNEETFHHFHEKKSKSAENSDIQNGYVTLDEFETSLNDIEKEVIYKDFLKKYLSKNHKN